LGVGEGREGMDGDDSHNGDSMEELPSGEVPIDLNTLFSTEGRDLNRLFPDPHFRRFLKDLKRNQREVKRFLKRLEDDGSNTGRSGGSHEVS
jgi:hypothetical protein